MAEQQTSRRSRGTAVRWFGLLGAVGVATLGLPGCGGDDSQTGGAIMNVTMTFTPNPATAVVSAQGYDWVAPYQVTLEETGGLGGTVTNINVNTYEVAGSEPGAEAEDSDTVLELPGTRVAANGTLELTFNTHYTLASGDKPAFIDVFIYFIDDAGFNAQVGQRLTVQ